MSDVSKQNFEELERLLDRYFLYGLNTQQTPPVIVNLLSRHNIYKETDATADHFWKAQVLLLALKKGASEMTSFEGDILHLAPTDQEPYCVYGAGLQIREALVNKDWQRVTEAFVLLRTLKRLLHPVALPTALTHLKEQYSIWHLWRDIAPSRSLWMAHHNPAWKWWADLHQDSHDVTLHRLIWMSIHGRTVPTAEVLSVEADTWHRFLKFLESHVSLTNYDLMQHLYDEARSRKIRQKALARLLMARAPQVTDELDVFIPAFAQLNISAKQGHVEILEDFIFPDFELSFDVSGLDMFTTSLPSATHRILALGTLDQLFGHLELTQDEIFKQLLVNDKLEHLAQSTIFSLASRLSVEAGYEMCEAWMDLYPEGNAVNLHLDGLFQRLNSQQVEKLVRHILKMEYDEYQIEKLSLLLRSIQCYLSHVISKRICKVLLEAVDRGIHQTDKRNIKECLPNLKYRLDPKALLTIKKIWPDDALYYSDLQKPFWDFRNTLEQRYELFLYISGSK